MTRIRTTLLSCAAAALLLLPAAHAQQQRQLSPRGKASTQVGGTWQKRDNGEMGYVGGKWIDIDYGRPILRGRANVFGSGDDYGKDVYHGAPVWRVGANQSTQLTTEVPLVIGGKRLEPGSYRLFMDLKPDEWTLIVSTQPRQKEYDPKNKSAIWGSYGYDSKFDVVRVAMKVNTTQTSLDQFTISFVNVTDQGGSIMFWWQNSRASVPFRVGM
jgi:hypothetical protein